ncbi:Tetratricopeptide [Nostoc flagelliforme CCNUN1]|uniref:Tetratricopeptide n=1 Tax=Nostoc flagelliforme CCNUN1 TaxID=2038116 RepID=A0A2K8SLM2_9NOSO|nr:Tetratricopeptide [Nostoc flagelliforme CCNUN1]
MVHSLLLLYCTQLRTAINGLAEIHQQQAFALALTHHTEAIELLDKIGAKCDLAEAYFQLGLTYQKMAKPDDSQMNFNRAIQLFTEIKAPKQVEKISNCAAQACVNHS